MIPKVVNWLLDYPPITFHITSSFTNQGYGSTAGASKVPSKQNAAADDDIEAADEAVGENKTFFSFGRDAKATSEKSKVTIKL